MFGIRLLQKLNIDKSRLKEKVTPRSSRWLFLFFLSVFLPTNVGRASAIECGDVLTRGQYILDRDLTCGIPGSTNPNAVGITVVDSVLDMAGHTLTCASSYATGIRGEKASFRNGTVTGCRLGILMQGDFQVLQSVILTHNTLGLHAEGGGGFFLDNTAIDNSFTGFEIGADPRTRPVQIINNTAQGNGRYGFVLASGSASIMGNTATGNEVGFVLSGLYHAWVSGNFAMENTQAGYWIVVGNDRTTMENNVAYRNDLGFWFFGNNRVMVRDNLALENLLDGFWIQFLGQGLDMRENSAFRNGQHGFEITTGAVTGRVPRTIRLRNNISLGHDAPYFDLAEENEDCAGVLWQKNTFDTRSQACIK